MWRRVKDELKGIEKLWQSRRTSELRHAAAAHGVDSTVAGVALALLADLEQWQDLFELATDPGVHTFNRERAVYEFAKRARPDLLMALARNAALDTNLRLPAIHGLGEGQEVGMLRELVHAHEVYTEVRREAVLELGRQGQAEILRGLLQNPYADFSVSDLALEQLQDAGASVPVIAIVKDPRTDVRLREYAASFIDDARQLVRLAHNRKLGATIRRAAVKSLALRGRTTELLALARAADADTHTHPQCGACLAAPSGTGRRLAVVCKERRCLTSEFATMRFQLENLGRVADLAMLARDPHLDSQLVATAIYALGAQGEQKIIEELIRDPALRLDAREEAVRALGRMAGQEQLLAMARDPDLDTEVRASAVYDLESPDHLVTLVHDTRLDTRAPQCHLSPGSHWARGGAN